jgi:hypothetical protein
MPHGGAEIEEQVNLKREPGFRDLTSLPVLAMAGMTRMLRMPGMAILCSLLAACSQPPVIDEEMKRFEGAMPADLGGSWERNYSRDDEVNAVLYQLYNQLARTSPDQRYSTMPGVAGPSSNDMASVMALARLADLITRPHVLTISQNEHEISVERKDDFAILCAFYDGVAKGTESDYGTEICGWDGKQLISSLVLPDGLQVTHRFTISDDGQQLRVATTVSSSTSRVPFTLRRFYTKFERLPPTFNCIETLSMKRVCSTGEIVP